MKLSELIEVALHVPAPMRVERDITIDRVKYHAVIYRRTQAGQDIIGADLRSIDKTKAPKRKSSHGKEANPGENS